MGSQRVVHTQPRSRRSAAAAPPKRSQRWAAFHSHMGGGYCLCIKPNAILWGRRGGMRRYVAESPKRLRAGHPSPWLWLPKVSVAVT